MSAIAPAIIAVGGTLGGGTLSALVSIWTAKAAYIRQKLLDTDKALSDRAERERDHRRQIYAEWIVITERLADAATEDRTAEIEETAGLLIRTSAAIMLSGSALVRDAVDAEQGGWLRVIRVLADRQLEVEAARALHDGTLNAMRDELISGW